MLETQLLHFVNGVVALLAAAIPIYLTVKLNNNLRQLTAILSIFILVHAVHSWLGFFGFDFLSDGIFEPLSAAVLMLFGISARKYVKEMGFDKRGYDINTEAIEIAYRSTSPRRCIN